MRYMPGGAGLAVLNAETFDDGVVRNRRSTNVTNRKGGASATSSSSPSLSPPGHDRSSPTPAPAKKRARTTQPAAAAAATAANANKDPAAAAEQSEQNDEGKRQRGRPRLDTKDQTAAERRRTQIRLAQRAYRNRKENAITTLEARVKDLKEANEEMSSTFMKLYDFAMNQGFLSQLPGFAQQFQATTDKFVALSKKSSEDVLSDGHEGESNSENERSRSQSNGAEVIDAGSRRNLKPTALYGLMVSHEAVTQPHPVGTLAAPYAPQPAVTQPFQNFEVIAQPTLENASFPVGANAGSPYRTGFEVSPWGSALPPPQTMSYQEISFGRRLQRFSLERGLALINNPHPQPERYAQVFGFCLIFESREGIKDRLTEVLNLSTTEAMHFWRAPFHNLGGSGTWWSRHWKHQLPPTPPQSHSTEGVEADATSPTHHQGPQYPVHENGQRLGNYGLHAPYRHPHNTGFGMGPFTENVTRVRDERLQGFRINVPGWEGNFFDSDEVEIYLQKHGVVISPGSDYIKANIDVDAFTYNDMIRHNEFVPPPPPPPGLDMGFGSIGLDLSSASGQQTQHAASNTTPTSHISDNLSLSGSGLVTTGIDTGTINAFAAPHGWQPEPPRVTQAPPQQQGPADFYIPFGQQASAANASFTFDMNNFTNQPVPTPPGRKTIQLDVNAFIDELAGRATCLGRSPGFRPADINAAFWASAQTVG